MLLLVFPRCGRIGLLTKSREQWERDARAGQTLHQHLSQQAHLAGLLESPQLECGRGTGLDQAIQVLLERQLSLPFSPGDVARYLEGRHVWGCYDALNLTREATEFLGHHGVFTLSKCNGSRDCCRLYSSLRLSRIALSSLPPQRLGTAFSQWPLPPTSVTLENLLQHLVQL